jgi:selenocysteine lyase/cysteine desulfurase
VKPGAKVVISGFEHNAVVRPLYGLDARLEVAGRKLFDWENTLSEFEDALKKGADCAVFTHMSNVFGYILPVEEMAALCRRYGVPFIVDAAQSAGSLPVSLSQWGANFIAMPGHKGLLGPQGTGLLLCRKIPQPLLFGGTGSNSAEAAMPEFLPDRLEAGTLNVPGIAGLDAGMAYVQRLGLAHIFSRSANAAAQCAKGLADRDIAVFSGTPQAGTLSFQTRMDVEAAADKLARKGIALRAGLHCAPLAHESSGTGDRGTLRLSFGHDACSCQIWAFLQAIDSCGIR